MYPGIFVLSLDLTEEIREFSDLCIQRHYIIQNYEFRELVNFALAVINSGGDIPAISSRIDTLVSTICCFVESNFIMPGINSGVTHDILYELEQMLMNEINVFITNLLNKMQLVYRLITVDNYGCIVTPYYFELLEIHNLGSCNVKVTHK